jgi:hypothetical protein
MACMATIAPGWWGGSDDDGDNRHSTSVARQKIRPTSAMSKHWLLGQRTANNDCNGKR